MGRRPIKAPKALPHWLLDLKAETGNRCPSCGSTLWTRPYYPYPHCAYCGWRMLHARERPEVIDEEEYQG